MRILIVEDDSRIHQSLADDLRRQHHAVDVVEDGLAGLNFASTGVHDVILLDILLPGMDGLELCKRLRDEHCSAYIIMITARDAVGDKVRALDTGADDYVVKPFDLAELAARIRALSRRQPVSQEPVLVRGELRLDPRAGTVSCRDALLPLTRSEYAILETLMRRPLQVFSRAMLHEKCTTFEDKSDNASVKTHVTNIRRKVRAAGGTRDPVESVYGIGYRLADA